VNRFPTWKYVLIAVVVLAAALYTVPNFFGESPAVQISSAKSTIKVDTALMSRAEDILRKANVPYTGMQLDATGVRVRLPDPDTQLKAKDLLERALNPDSSDSLYTVALNLLPASPNWLSAIHALPMYLGLDLRGGVHFLLQIDMQAAITKRIENLAADVRGQLREKGIRHGGVTREGQTIRVRVRDAATRDAARGAILSNLPDLAVSP
jgi:preprotein translocase subunit SecD